MKRTLSLLTLGLLVHALVVADSAAEPASTALVKEWRQKMVQHLAIRGDAWVRGGDLVVQPTAMLRRPNAANGVQ
jgi:hypothetical protein